MLRVLFIPLADCELPRNLSLPRFHCEYAATTEAGIEWLSATPCDVIVVVARGTSAGASEVCAAIEATCGADVVPLLLAVDSRDSAARSCFESLPFDALVDLNWDEALIDQCIAHTVARVKTGRGVAAIQQQVLRAVRTEVAELKNLSIRDEITGLYNSRHFRETIEREHKRCVRHDHSYAVVAFDLDNLREINNRYGHPTGSRALARMGMTLAAVTRDSDGSFRVGGDEFMTVLVEADRAAAKAHAERVCSALRRCVLMEGNEQVALTTSVGVAVFPEDGLTVDDVLAAADQALYRAKALGKNQVVVKRNSPSKQQEAHAPFQQR